MKTSTRETVISVDSLSKLINFPIESPLLKKWTYIPCLSNNSPRFQRDCFSYPLDIVARGSEFPRTEFIGLIDISYCEIPRMLEYTNFVASETNGLSGTVYGATSVFPPRLTA